MTATIRAGETLPCSSTFPTAATIPPLMSGVVGDLERASTFGPSIRTASVLVPPTSTPMRTRLRYGDGVRSDKWEVMGK